MEQVANEASVMLSDAQQRVHKDAHNLNEIKVTVADMTKKVNIAKEDMEDAISCVKTMERCGPPTIEHMMEKLNSSISLMNEYSSNENQSNGVVTILSSAIKGASRVSMWRSHANDSNSDRKQDAGGDVTERIKDCEASWTESRSKLEKDPLGRATNSDLDQAERERLFREYVNGLYERCVREYRSLLADVITMDAATKHLEDGKNILTSWSEAKRLLKPDQRYARMPRRERELWWRRYAEDVQRRVKAIPSYTERRSIFEHYVRTRADEERKEKRAAQKAAVEGFKQLLDEASDDITYKTDYENFAKKWGDDHRFEALDRKERESLLNERVLPLRRALEEKVKAIQAASTASFKAMLRNRGDITSGSRWSKVKDSLRSDSRYKAVKREDREALFNEYVDEKRAAEQEAERAAKAKRDEEEKLKERKREMLKRKEREEHEMERMTGGRYSIVEKLGSGSFGEVYKGIDVETEENAAIKMERKDAKHPQLFHDSKIYEHISDGIGIPNIRWRGTKIDHSIPVLDLLGSSLRNIFGYRQCKFNLEMVLMLADQLIERIEYIYRRSVLHKDLKLDDLLMGISLTSKLVHLNDFGLSKLFQNSNSMRHIPLTTNKGLTRTVHYASINNHRGIEQSRRDDIESIGYALLYFLRGNLPWQDVMDSNKKRKFENICEMKMATPIEYLCYEDDNVFEWTPMLKRHRLQNSRAGVPGPLPPVESESSSPSVTPPPLPLEAFPLLKDINFPMTNDFKRYNDQFMMFRGRNILKSEAM